MFFVFGTNNELCIRAGSYSSPEFVSSASVFRNTYPIVTYTVLTDRQGQLKVEGKIAGFSLETKSKVPRPFCAFQIVIVF